jgi:hypothetical protein
MGSRRFRSALVAAAMAGSTAVLVAPGLAAADGTTAVAVTCSGIPIIGTTQTSVNVNATDSVDPVTAGGTVTNTINVPVPVDSVPVEVTVTEVKLTVPIPTGVTVTNVTFTPSSFSGTTWSVNNGNLIATLTGSVKVGGSNPAPTVPDVQVQTTVAGPARTVQWKVPTSVVAKASSFLGPITATCTPDDLTQVLISTTVVNPNQAPTATDQNVPVAFETATPITLSGTDPDANPLTFLVAGQPSHGTLTGTEPNLTYTPADGYTGGDSFTFTASDGSLSDLGTISITVSPAATTEPGSPVIATVSAAQGQATVTWTPPVSNGGSAITGYVVTPVADGTPLGPIEVGPGTLTATATGLDDGVPHTFRVAAKNAVGTGPYATSGAVTPQWWLPWSSGPVAVNELFTWLTGTGPSDASRTSWLGQLNAGTKLPADLVAALRAGTDATANVDPTVRLYAAYLTRVPDASGLNFWLNRRRSGWTLSRISSNFAGSSEFIRRYGTMTNRQFVENIYVNVLQRAGETSGINFWVNQLDTKRKSRGQVMINFSESSEYKRKQVENVHAAVVFIHLRGKTPTTAERDAFAAALKGGATLEELVTEQIHLPAFDTRAG